MWTHASHIPGECLNCRAFGCFGGWGKCHPGPEKSSQQKFNRNWTFPQKVRFGWVSIFWWKNLSSKNSQAALTLTPPSPRSVSVNNKECEKSVQAVHSAYDPDPSNMQGDSSYCLVHLICVSNSWFLLYMSRRRKETSPGQQLTDIQLNSWIQKSGVFNNFS